MTAILDEIKALECSLHTARRNDKQWLERVLHQGFREITRSDVAFHPIIFTKTHNPPD